MAWKDLDCRLKDLYNTIIASQMIIDKLQSARAEERVLEMLDEINQDLKFADDIMSQIEEQVNSGIVQPQPVDYDFSDNMGVIRNVNNAFEPEEVKIILDDDDFACDCTSEIFLRNKFQDGVYKCKECGNVYGFGVIDADEEEDGIDRIFSSLLLDEDEHGNVM